MGENISSGAADDVTLDDLGCNVCNECLLQDLSTRIIGLEQGTGSGRVWGLPYENPLGS